MILFYQVFGKSHFQAKSWSVNVDVIWVMHNN